MLHGPLSSSSPSSYPAIFQEREQGRITLSPGAQHRAKMAVLVPFPAPSHALVIALVVVLACTVHTVLSASSDHNHTHFDKVERGGGNAPSLKPGGEGSGLAGGPEPALSASLEGCGCEPALSASLEGCGCEPAPAPWDFENQKLAALYPVIQAFRLTITDDPQGVTKTWTGTKICDSFHGGGMYKGFYCDYPPDANTTLTVASIDFNGFHLRAPTLAGFIDKFPDLALFHANSNNFSGVVPDLTSLRYFYELDLSNNDFSGPFPGNVVPLGGLLFLDLRFNRFAGEVPAPVFDLTVEALFLNNNGFYGRIPDSLGSTTAEYLVLANNEFTGPIPRSIYNTSANLTEVLFLNNKLSGCLPYEIGLVEGLQVFDAGGNEITGPIPLSFGCLGVVEELNLAGNQLYGHVPDVLCLLAKTGKLENLSLSDNYFHSVGHHCMELVRNRKLDVHRNCILGFPGQRPALECTWFYADPPNHCPFVPHIPCDLPGFRPPAAAAAAAKDLPAGHGHRGGSGN